MHSSLGFYVVTDGYFTQPVVNGPLTALADGTDGPNGLYRYSATAFPNLAYQASNYWVDVVFRDRSDSTPPTVTTRTPSPGATGVAATANVTATFSEALAAATVNTNTVQLRDAASNLVGASVSWNGAALTATLDPTADLAFSTTYTATVRGGAGGVTDSSGNALAADVTWSFTTGAAGPDTTPPTVTAMGPSPGGDQRDRGHERHRDLQRGARREHGEPGAPSCSGTRPPSSSPPP